MGKEEGSEAGGGEPNKTNIMETNLKLSREGKFFQREAWTDPVLLKQKPPV